MRRFSFAAFTLLVLGLGEAAAEATVTGARITWFGIFQAAESKAVPDKTSPTGTRLQSTGIVPPKSNSDRIPAVLNTRFGVGYFLEGKPDGDSGKVRHLRLFPPGGIVNPKTGQRADSLDVELNLTVGREWFLGYTFREPWEIVPGVWTIQVWSSNRKLIEKQFTVHKP